MADFRLDPQDEYPHAPGGASNFNESVYANAFDTKQRVGGWMRIGNRINEGHAELAVCLYLPDGRIACQFKRPRISSNEQFSAGGLSVDVKDPFKHLVMRYEGEVMLVTDPEQLREPETGLKDLQRVPASVRWDMHGVSPMHGGRPTRDDQQTMYGRDFSLNHFNQHTRVTGEMRIGDRHWTLDAHGWRDHSWGPRNWDSISSYRLFMANFGDGHGLMLLRITNGPQPSRRVGVLMIDHEYHEILDLDVTSKWSEGRDPTSATIAVRTANGREEIDVEMITVAPLRNRRQANGKELSIRVFEMSSRFTWGKRVAYGMSEYIERMDEGRLPGLPV